MANRIIPKRSTVAARVPTTGDLEVGEIAINLTDRKIYTRNAGGVVEIPASSSGAGVTVSSSAPSSPTQGDMWLDTINAIQFTRYASAWVEF